MAWCENENCKKDGLRKADIEFDETTRKVLCHGCMCLVHPGWVPPNEYVDVSGYIPTVVSMDKEPKFGLAFQMNEKDGLKAGVSYGNISLAIHIPNDDFQRMFGD